MREGELVRRGFGACASAIFILMVLLFSILYLWCLCDLILTVLDIMAMMKIIENNWLRWELRSRQWSPASPPLVPPWPSSRGQRAPHQPHVEEVGVGEVTMVHMARLVVLEEDRGGLPEGGG